MPVVTVKKPHFTDDFMMGPQHSMRRYTRRGDYADAYHSGMVGYWLTRQRLASKPGYGKWERVDSVYYKLGREWQLLRALVRMLPPECVAPANMKIRSGRDGVSIGDIVLAAAYLPDTTASNNKAARIRYILDKPIEEIKTLANMYRLSRLVA